MLVNQLLKKLNFNFKNALIYSICQVQYLPTWPSSYYHHDVTDPGSWL